MPKQSDDVLVNSFLSLEIFTFWLMSQYTKARQAIGMVKYPNKLEKSNSMHKTRIMIGVNNPTKIAAIKCQFLYL